jgi:hypothetical protein
MANNLTVTGALAVTGASVLTGVVDFPGGALNTDLVTNFNADLLDSAHKSIDGTLASNSDALIPTEKAVKTYADLRALDSAVVHDTGDETVAGIKTFSSIPVLPASDPTTDNQAARKAYVDGLDAANVKLTGTQIVAGTKTFSGTIAFGGVADPAAGIRPTGSYDGDTGITQNAIFDILDPIVPDVGMIIRASGAIKIGASVYIVHKIYRSAVGTIKIYGMTTAGVLAELSMVDGSATAVDAVSVSW